MEKICGVIDCQGFQFKDRFVPREIAIASESMSQCQEFNARMNWRDLTEEEQGIVLRSTKYRHGLHYCPFNPKEHCFLPTPDDVGEIITRWYKMISTKEKNLLAYKNYQMGEILKQLKIPSFNLDETKLNFPSYEKIQEKYGDNYLCCYHKKPHRLSNIVLTCAYRKANHLLRELNEAKEFEEMVV